MAKREAACRTLDSKGRISDAPPFWWRILPHPTGIMALESNNCGYHRKVVIFRGLSMVEGHARFDEITRVASREIWGQQLEERNGKWAHYEPARQGSLL